RRAGPLPRRVALRGSADGERGGASGHRQCRAEGCRKAGRGGIGTRRIWLSHAHGAAARDAPRARQHDRFATGDPNPPPCSLSVPGLGDATERGGWHTVRPRSLCPHHRRLMRIVHTSDWHAGRIWKNVSRLPELAAVLEYLGDFVEHEKIDIVVISGDV